MREFQERTGVLKVDTQANAIFEGITSLNAQIAAKEVELQVMRTYFTPNNTDLQKNEEMLNGLKNELSKLEKKNEGSSSSIIPTNMMPGLSVEYFRKLRELKYSEKIFEVMAQQYELSKIEEGKEPFVIEILEKAAPTEERHGPARKLMILKATFISLLLTVIIAFLKEYIERIYVLGNRKDNEKMEILKQLLSFKKIKG